MGNNRKYDRTKLKYLDLVKEIQKGGGKENIFGIKRRWLRKIENGSKTVEGRLYKGRFANLRVGDKVIWVNEKLKVETFIVYLRKYNNFQTLLSEESIEKVYPEFRQ